MQVKDLQARQGKIDIELDIVDVGDVRQFEKFGKSGRVVNAIAKDDSGDIKLTLWNDDIDKVKPGDRIKITDGYVSEWQGEKQLSTGKFGKIEVIGESESTKKEMASPPNEDLNKKEYAEYGEDLEKAESKLEEGPDFDEEDIKDE